MVDNLSPRVSLNEAASRYIRWRYPAAMNDAERVRAAINNAMYSDFVYMRYIQLLHEENDGEPVNPGAFFAQAMAAGEGEGEGEDATLADALMGGFDVEDAEKIGEMNFPTKAADEDGDADSDDGADE